MTTEDGMPQHWTYEEVTRETARLIQFLVLRTASLPEQQAGLFRSWAYGVFRAWEELTLNGRGGGDGGEQRMRDYVEQLSALRESVGAVLGDGTTGCARFSADDTEAHRGKPCASPSIRG